MAFAENLRALRKVKGLSQAELAVIVDVSQPMIAQYEKGVKVPTVITGVSLAETLGTTCEELVNGKKLKRQHKCERRNSNEFSKNT